MRTSRVAPARIGAAIIGASFGISGSLPGTVEIIVADISIRTVPATVGVMIRRSSESLVMNANCIRAEIAMRLDSIAGPPSDNAVMHTAMNAEADATRSEYPEPNRQKRVVWKILPKPQVTRLAKNIHDR